MVAGTTYASFFLVADHPQPAVYAAPLAAVLLARVHVAELPRARAFGTAWLVFLALACAGLTLHDARGQSVTISGSGGSLHVTPAEAPAYREDAGFAADSMTETFVAAKLYVDNWRWAGTPFYVRPGKRMPQRETTIAIQFKRAPHPPFAREDSEGVGPNILLVHVQPDEGVSLAIGAKVPGQGMTIRTVHMDFLYGGSGNDVLIGDVGMNLSSATNTAPYVAGLNGIEAQAFGTDYTALSGIGARLGAQQGALQAMAGTLASLDATPGLSSALDALYSERVTLAQVVAGTGDTSRNIAVGSG